MTGSVTVVVVGQYSTAICGTGNATAVLQFSGRDGGRVLVEAQWAFAAFQGPMVLSGPGTGSGTWHWSPNTGGCVTGPVLSFLAYGDVALETVSVG